MFRRLGLCIFMFVLMLSAVHSNDSILKTSQDIRVSKMLGKKHKSARLLIKLKPDNDLNYFSSHLITVRQKFPLDSFATEELRSAAREAGVDRWYVADLDSDSNMAMAMSEIIDQPEVESVEPIYEAQLTDITINKILPKALVYAQGADPLFSEQWSLENNGQKGGLPGFDLRAKEFVQSIDKTPESQNTTLIHQLDSGIDVDHPDIKNFPYTNKGEIPNNRIDDDHNGYVDDYNGYNSIDDNGSLFDSVRHGTAVASVMGATVDNGIGMKGLLGKLAGKNFFVLMSKFLTLTAGSYEDAGESVIYGYKMGAKVTNHSWTGEYSQYVYDVFKMGELLGHIHVCAAGNKGMDTDAFFEYPAAFSFDPKHRLYNVIAVSSSNRFGALSKFSAFGSGIQVSAPGEDIVCALANTSDYFTASGTSLSAPFVSVAVAVLINRNPERYYTLIMDDVLRLSRGHIGLESKLQNANTLDVSHLLIREDARLPLINNFKYIRKQSTSQSIYLKWQAPINNSNICSGIYGYELRYSEKPWDQDIFEITSPVKFNPAPVSNGTKKQAWFIHGLRSKTDYFVGIRWRDSCGNLSPFSIIQVKTKK